MENLIWIPVFVLALVGAWTILKSLDKKPRTGAELDTYDREQRRLKDEEERRLDALAEEQRREHTEARGKRKQRGVK